MVATERGGTPEAGGGPGSRDYDGGAHAAGVGAGGKSLFEHYPATRRTRRYAEQFSWTAVTTGQLQLCSGRILRIISHGHTENTNGQVEMNEAEQISRRYTQINAAKVKEQDSRPDADDADRMNFKDQDRMSRRYAQINADKQPKDQDRLPPMDADERRSILGGNGTTPEHGVVNVEYYNKP